MGLKPMLYNTFNPAGDRVKDITMRFFGWSTRSVRHSSRAHWKKKGPWVANRLPFDSH